MTVKVQVVTGGAGGMGLAICRRVAKRGPLFVVDISEEKIDRARKLLVDEGISDASYVCCDISDKEQVQALVREVEKAGSLGSVIHTAAYSPIQQPAERICEVNAGGAVQVMDAFYRLMGLGSALITITSVAGHMAPMLPLDEDEFKDICDDPHAPDFLERFKKLVEGDAGYAYVYSKNFCMRYTRENVVRWAQKGARILTLSCGCFTTPMGLADMSGGKRVIDDTPLARWGDPDEIAAVAEFMSSDQASYVSGCDILVDGGYVAKLFNQQYDMLMVGADS